MKLTTGLFCGAASLLITGTALAAAFDLSTLADGETRVFATGGKAATATRTGDAVSVLIQKPGDDDRTFECALATDVCTVDVDDADQVIKLMVRREVEHDDLGDGDSGQQVVRIRHGSGGKTIELEGGDHGAMFISDDGGVHAIDIDNATWVDGDATIIRKEVICNGDGDDVECGGLGDIGGVDLGTLGLGETRVFGTTDDGVTATRNGDMVWMTLHTEEGDRQMQCDLTAESCNVLVHETDGDTKVMVMKRAEGEGAIGHEVMMTGGDGNQTTIIIEREATNDDGVRVKRVRKTRQ